MTSGEHRVCARKDTSAGFTEMILRKGLIQGTVKSYSQEKGGGFKRFPLSFYKQSSGNSTI